MSELIGGWVAGLTATLIREGINKHRAREIAQGYWEAYCKDDAEAEVERLREANEKFGLRQEWWNRKMFELEAEVERLRGVLKTDSEQQAAHIRGLNESWEAEREILAAEVERFTSERDAFMEMAERLTADLEALRARVFVRR